VYLIITQVEQPALPSPRTQPARGDIQVESTHQAVVLLAAAVVVGGLAELVPATTVRVMTTAATAPILRTERIMALGKAGASPKQPQPVGAVTGGDTASSVPLTMGEMSSALPGLHKKMPRTWMAVSTLNDADMFGGVTLIEVATGHGVDVCWMSLLRMMKPAEAASPGGSTILGTPGGQMPVWLTVTCKGVPALFRKVTTG
jgi:hypothetical protein